MPAPPWKKTRRGGAPLGLLLAFALAAAGAGAQSLALTFDDGPVMDDAVRMTAAERNAAILAQLREAGVKSFLFLTVKDDGEDRLALARQWGKEGHRIGNHTVTHPYFPSAKVRLEDFEREVVACDAVIKTLPGYTRRFRFPYLKEGDTAVKRDGLRAFLRSLHYRPGPVSIDTSDWVYNARLKERLKREPGADLAPYRDAYLAHLWDRATYYDGLSRQVLGRSVRHVMLLHHNLINALFLKDVIQRFRDKGWRVVDATRAFEDPVYRRQPKVLPAGESLLWSLAKEKGRTDLRSPGEDDVYEKPILDRLGL